MSFKALSHTQQRIIVGLCTGSFAALSIFLLNTPFLRFTVALVVIFAIGVSMWEFYNITKVKGFQPATKLGIALGILYAIMVTLNTQIPFFNRAPEIVLFISLLSCFLYFFVKGNLPIINLSITIFGIAYLAIPLSFIISIGYFFQPDDIQDSRWWITYLIMITKLTDTAAFFVGSKFGRQHLAPYISPKKTWEGAFGGFLAATLGSVGLTYFAHTVDPHAFTMTIEQSIWLGACLGILSQCGDLAESLLKRDCGIKDSSAFIPVVGGMLDTTDSVVFTAPLIYIFLKVYAG